MGKSSFYLLCNVLFKRYFCYAKNKIEVLDNNERLKAWYITGITDAEGSFQISIQDIEGKGLTGFKPFLEFKITQKNNSINVLIEICGRIIIDNRKTNTM